MTDSEKLDLSGNLHEAMKPNHEVDVLGYESKCFRI